MAVPKIRFKFKEASGFRHVTATGVFGGPAPSGDLLCNFFLEHRVLPDEIILTPPSDLLSQTPPVEEPVFSDGKDIFIRELQVGIIMNARTAKAVGEWLVKRADEMMKKGPFIQ